MNAGADIKTVWSVPVSIDDIDNAGRHFNLVPDEETRARIANAIGVRALPKLNASFDVSRHGRDGLRVTGEVTAIVGQNCVVTLEAMESELCDEVDLVFAPPQAANSTASAMQLGLEAVDPPEILDNGVIDLGAIAIEFMLLGIDFYPRLPGVVFDAPAVVEPSSNPFATLASLKKRPGKDTA
ncbi:MAG: DUF177 domain-containing protein [Rhizobiales bacterium]|nr:DUF177 domain-containing protein [Hyphomicrobiales bacterium]